MSSTSSVQAAALRLEAKLLQSFRILKLRTSQLSEVLDQARFEVKIEMGVTDEWEQRVLAAELVKNYMLSALRREQANASDATAG